MGGEPLLDKKRLLLFLRLCHLKGFRCVFPTNGSLLTRPYFKQLLHAGLSELTISLDSYCAEEHDAIRGFPGLFDHVVTIIKHIKRDHPSFKINQNFVVLPQNINSLMRTISFSEELGIDSFIVLYPENFGKNFEKIQLTALNWQKIGSLRSQLPPSRKMHINWNPLNTKEIPGCTFQPEKIRILENGNIKLCDHYPFKRTYKLDRPLKLLLQEDEIQRFLSDTSRHCPLRSSRL
jgi:MoaA/NifB/PqqE/SkfB family radical SAM enzyme